MRNSTLSSSLHDEVFFMVTDFFFFGVNSVWYGEASLRSIRHSFSLLAAINEDFSIFASGPLGQSSCYFKEGRLSEKRLKITYWMAAD